MSWFELGVLAFLLVYAITAAATTGGPLTWRNMLWGACALFLLVLFLLGLLLALGVVGARR